MNTKDFISNIVALAIIGMLTGIGMILYGFWLHGLGVLIVSLLVWVVLASLSD